MYQCEHKHISSYTQPVHKQPAPNTYPFKRQSHKVVKHTQTIRREFADELFGCV